MNYRVDYEKQLFRTTKGNCRLWGKPAKSLAVVDQVTKRPSNLLVSSLVLHNTLKQRKGRNRRIHGKWQKSENVAVVGKSREFLLFFELRSKQYHYCLFLSFDTQELSFFVFKFKELTLQIRLVFYLCVSSYPDVGVVRAT